MNTRGERGSWVRWPILILLLVQLLNGMVVAAQFYFFPIYVEEALGLTAVIVSGLVSLGRVAGLVASLLGGGLADTLGRKWTLVLGLGCFAVGSLAFVVRVPWLVGALWFVNGMALSLESLGSQGYLIAAAGGASLGVTSALYHWGFTLGGALGSPIVGRLLDTRGYGDFGPVLIGMTGGTALLATVLMPPLADRPSREQRRIPLKTMLAGYVELVRQPRMLRLGMLRFLPTCYYGMAMLLLPLLINAQTGSKTSVAIFATSSQVLATLTQLAAGRAADKVGPGTPTLIAVAGVLSAALGLAAFAGQLWGLYFFGIVGIAAAWALSTLMPVLVSATVQAERQGRALGTLNLLWNLAMILSAVIGGVLVEVGPGLPFAVAAFLNTGALLVALSVFRGRPQFIARF